eukprot:TRINITY_DN675_c1_g1_i5.p1 TRINITY_DN675_c1_g1~~TRINITY_DN675_c1_g1_i5.p1  ORF type:complete len:1352 (+),score=357.92 TRINITY_DN675_c1_g1_i5:120-4175(+)
MAEYLLEVGGAAPGRQRGLLRGRLSIAASGAAADSGSDDECRLSPIAAARPPIAPHLLRLAEADSTEAAQRQGSRACLADSESGGSVVCSSVRALPPAAAPRSACGSLALWACGPRPATVPDPGPRRARGGPARRVASAAGGGGRPGARQQQGSPAACWGLVTDVVEPHPDALHWRPLLSVCDLSDWGPELDTCSRLKDLARKAAPAYDAVLSGAASNTGCGTSEARGIEVVLRHATEVSAGLGRPNPVLCCASAMLLARIAPRCGALAHCASRCQDVLHEALFAPGTAADPGEELAALSGVPPLPSPASARSIPSMRSASAPVSLVSSGLSRSGSRRSPRSPRSPATPAHPLLEDDTDPREEGELRKHVRRGRLTAVAYQPKQELDHLLRPTPTDSLACFLRRNSYFELYHRITASSRDVEQRALKVHQSMQKRMMIVDCGVGRWQSLVLRFVMRIWCHGVAAHRRRANRLRQLRDHLRSRQHLRKHLAAWRLYVRQTAGAKRLMSTKAQITALLHQGRTQECTVQNTRDNMNVLFDRLTRAEEEQLEAENKLAQAKARLEELQGLGLRMAKVTLDMLTFARGLKNEALTHRPSEDERWSTAERVLLSWVNEFLSRRALAASNFSSDWADGTLLLYLLRDVLRVPIEMVLPAGPQARFEEASTLLSRVGIEAKPRLLLTRQSDAVVSILFQLWHRYGHIPVPTGMITTAAVREEVQEQDFSPGKGRRGKRARGKRAAAGLGGAPLSPGSPPRTPHFLGGSGSGGGTPTYERFASSMLGDSPPMPRQVMLPDTPPVLQNPVPGSKRKSRVSISTPALLPASGARSGRASISRTGSGMWGRFSDAIEDILLDASNREDTVRAWIRDRQALIEGCTELMLRRCRGVPGGVLTSREISRNAHAVGSFTDFTRQQLVPVPCTEAELPPAEMDSLLLLASRYYSDLARVYTHYAKPEGIDYSGYYRFLADCKILNANFKKQQASRLFARLNQPPPASAAASPVRSPKGAGRGSHDFQCHVSSDFPSEDDHAGALRSGVRDSAEEAVNPMSVLTASEFFQLLVHLAFPSGRRKDKRGRPAAPASPGAPRGAKAHRASVAVQQLLEGCVLPNAGVSRVSSTRLELRTEDVQRLLAQYRPDITWLFQAYAAQDPAVFEALGRRIAGPMSGVPGARRTSLKGRGGVAGSGNDVNTMSKEEWCMFLTDFDLFDQVFTKKEGLAVYAKCQDDDGDVTAMVSCEFEEALCCVAAWKVPAPYTPTAGKVRHFLLIHILPKLQRLQQTVTEELRRRAAPAGGKRRASGKGRLGSVMPARLNRSPSTAVNTVGRPGGRQRGASIQRSSPTMPSMLETSGPTNLEVG